MLARFAGVVNFLLLHFPIENEKKNIYIYFFSDYFLCVGEVTKKVSSRRQVELFCLIWNSKTGELMLGSRTSFKKKNSGGKKSNNFLYKEEKLSKLHKV